MECICCKNTGFEIYAKDSWLKLPVNRCKKCGLYVTGNSLDELETALNQYYVNASSAQTHHEDLDNIINLDFNTRHGRYFLNQWKSHFEYCKEFFGLSKKLLEIGPGPGISLRMFEEKGFEVTGVDANEHCVKFLILFGLMLISNLEEKSSFKKNVGINDIKLAFPHLSPRPLIVP